MGKLNEDSLARRIDDLERWKLDAEARMQALERRVGAELEGSAPATRGTHRGIFIVAVTKKWFDPADLDQGRYEDHIWWDVVYTATGLLRAARSVKGRLEFCDLFGDARFRVKVTIDDPIEPGGTLQCVGVGIAYNEFMDEHRWLLSTELHNMTFRFEVDTILYQDGTVERGAP